MSIPFAGTVAVVRAAVVVVVMWSTLWLRRRRRIGRTPQVLSETGFAIVDVLQNAAELAASTNAQSPWSQQGQSALSSTTSTTSREGSASAKTRNGAGSAVGVPSVAEASEVDFCAVVVSLAVGALVPSSPLDPQPARSGTTAAVLSRAIVSRRIVSPSSLRPRTSQAGNDHESQGTVA